MSGTVDAHQHFWSLPRGDYGWLTPESGSIYRDFGPRDLEPLLDEAGIERTVLVQAAPTEGETRYLLDIAAATPWVAAVVGWADLAARNAPDRLATLAANPLLRGLRPMLQDLPDPEWMLGCELRPALAAMVELGLRFDALVKPQHLRPLLTFVERNPDLAVVIDHGAKPALRSGMLDPWAREIREIARSTTVCCKLSGLVTEAKPDWGTDDLRVCISQLLDCFAPDRLMWGSDWPVVELAGGYRRWHEVARACLSTLSAAERERIFGGNAARFYGFAPGGGLP
ncbi:MAG: amidohydrolase family protein [Betaproteobacteria bacterium]|nr:amidohydrolase family protein [Betaproteobacteria bacterium]MDE2208246.1 amidohydrolase family protein [Betaproteobacteria bacterium]MDE2358007.1 amidohydrolase family protein [Betaproteobacteria bacterium]